MTLTKTDIQAIKQALQPEFDKVRSEFSGNLDKVRSEFSGNLDKVRSDFAGEFDKVRAQAKQNFDTLNKKIESLRRSNRKDHNLILKYLDERDTRLEDKVTRLEKHVGLPHIV